MVGAHSHSSTPCLFCCQKQSDTREFESALTRTGTHLVCFAARNPGSQWTVGLPPTRWKERLGGMCPVPKHFLRPGCLASHQTPDELSEDKLGEGALRTIAGVAVRGQVQETALLRVVSRQRAANHEAAYIHVDTDDEAARHPRDEQHASTSLAGRPASRGCIRTSRPERRAAGAARVHLASEGSGFSSSGTSSF